MTSGPCRHWWSGARGGVALVALLTVARTRAVIADDADPDSVRAPEPPCVAATFYPWYDAPDERDRLRHHPLDAASIHPDSAEWYARELRELARAGIDVALIASVPRAADGTEAAEWMAALAQAFDATHGRLERPVHAALLLDPFFVAAERAGGIESDSIAKLDLASAADRAALVEPIDRFFAELPADAWARLGDAPLVVLGSSGAVTSSQKEHQASDQAALFAAIAERVVARTGKPPALVVERSWLASDAAPDTLVWQAGSGVLGPRLGAGTMTIAPGFDDRVTARPLGLVRPRERGAVYAAAWERVLEQKPQLVILESWNQLHDGTALCVALEHGRRYADATRRFSDLLRTGASAPRSNPAPRLPDPILAESLEPDRELAFAEAGLWRPDDEERGIELISAEGARLDYVGGGDGSEATLHVEALGTDRPATLRFRVSPVLIGDEVATNAPLAIELTVRSGAARLEQCTAGAATKANGGVIVAVDSNADLTGLRVARPGRALPAGRLGINDPRLLLATSAERDSRIAAAKASGAAWLRFELDWPSLEKEPGALDLTSVADGVARCRAAGMEPVAAVCGTPRFAQPLAAHPEAIEPLARALAALPGLRFVELFPGANEPGDFSRGVDPQGYVRMLRTASMSAHAVDPSLSLVLGAVAGPDATWLATIAELRERFRYDALALAPGPTGGVPGSATFDHELERLAGGIETGRDGGKPRFIELAESRAASATADDARVLARLIATAWKRLARAPEPVDVADCGELPIVTGLPAAWVAAQLGAAGLAVTARPLGDLFARLNRQQVRTLVVAQGRLIPRDLAAALPTFIDHGGLLVLAGAAPLERSATALADGGFTLDEDRTLVATVKDDLRIAFTNAQPRSGVLAEGLEAVASPLFVDAPAIRRESIGSLFTRRTGRPLNPARIHRYDGLINLGSADAAKGEVAALLAYGGPAGGGTLLLGLDFGTTLLAPEARAREAVVGVERATRLGARAVFVPWDFEANPFLADGLRRWVDGVRQK